MPLLSLWKAEPSVVDGFTIQQVVSFSGNGKLLDGSDCSLELREYLSSVSSDKLAQYAQYCLSESFEKSGQVLQDIVNELGRRLDYKVQNGLYAGKKNSIGNDGLWHGPEGNSLIVEVKTTDAYRIPLDTIANYRIALQAHGEITAASSILIVVGREDTGELEAQVRGSRHAWDVRLISVDALIKLVEIKENADANETGKKIRSVLVPVEYTRVDNLVDVVFAAASDVQEVELVPSGDNNSVEQTKKQSYVSDKLSIQAMREKVVSSFSSSIGVPLLKKTRALFWSADHSRRVVCAVSKRYESGSAYWYAFHSAWQEFLNESPNGVFAMSCLDQDRFFAIPVGHLEKYLPQMNKTDREDGFYWHIKLDILDNGDIHLWVPKHQSVNLEKYAIKIGKP